MSDASSTGAPAPSSKSPLKACCCVAVLGAALSACLLLGYVGKVAKDTKSDAPLAFEPFAYRPLERGRLAAKFQFLELPSRLLTGGDAPVELTLNERELNALLFGEAAHSEQTEKARVVIRPDDKLQLEYSKAEGATFTNVTCLISIAVGPGVANLQLHEGTIGRHELSGMTRGWLEKQFQRGFKTRYDRDPRLRRIRSLNVESGTVRVSYTPKR